MAHPYIINLINAFVLLLAGLVYFFVHPDQPATALIPPAFGLLLFACTHHLRRHNRFVFHSVSSLTLVAAMLLLLQVNLEAFGWSLRNILLLLMGLSCFGAVVLYVATFIQERRLRDNSVYKDDL